MSQFEDLFVDRAAAAIMEAMPNAEPWPAAGAKLRDHYRDLARAALDATRLVDGSKANNEAARYLLRDETAIKAAAGSLPPAEVVTAVLWLLINLSDRKIDVAELLEWLGDSLAAGAGDLRALAEILDTER